MKCLVVNVLNCLLFSQFFGEFFCSIVAVELHLFRPPGTQICYYTLYHPQLTLNTFSFATSKGTDFDCLLLAS